MTSILRIKSLELNRESARDLVDQIRIDIGMQGVTRNTLNDARWTVLSQFNSLFDQFEFQERADVEWAICNRRLQIRVNGHNLLEQAYYLEYVNGDQKAVTSRLN